jgi:hypothetical protein
LMDELSPRTPIFTGVSPANAVAFIPRMSANPLANQCLLTVFLH